uniref:Uncharacterized protein n=1 Tax=Anguilla anguilla TaxID=7936 RepID=A0A0E9XRH1_ANGAN
MHLLPLQWTRMLLIFQNMHYLCIRIAGGIVWAKQQNQKNRIVAQNSWKNSLNQQDIIHQCRRSENIYINSL